MTIYNTASFLVGGGGSSKKNWQANKNKKQKRINSIFKFNKNLCCEKKWGNGMPRTLPGSPTHSDATWRAYILLPDLSGFGFSFYRMFRKHGKGRVTKIENKWSVKKLVKILSWFWVWKALFSYGLPYAYVNKAHICNGLRGSIWEPSTNFHTDDAYVSGIGGWCPRAQCYVPRGLCEGVCYSGKWPPEKHGVRDSAGCGTSPRPHTCP